MTERISRRDAVFFQLEGRTTPYHMASLLILDGRAPDLESVRATVVSRLPALPRFRQRVHPLPLTGRLEWRDDDDFDISCHVLRTTLTDPANDKQLNDLVATLMAQHLNRHRPLWEMWVIDGLPNSHSAILLKAHHATVDGVAGARNLTVLFDGQADGATAPRKATERALLSRGWDALSMLPGLVMGAASTVERTLSPAPRTLFNRPIGPNRAFGYAEVPLQDLKDVKDHLGGTVNDVVLAAVTGSLRRLLLERGVSLGDLELRGLVPVSLRGMLGGDTSGNVVGGVLAPLPVNEVDPVRRLARIRDSMHTASKHREAVANGLLLQMPALLPRVGTGIVSWAEKVQRFFNISLPNIRGPEESLYLGGRRIVRIIPLPPLSGNAGLIICAMSYRGAMTFGILSDPTVVPEVDVIAEGLEKSIAELRLEGG